MIYFTSDTHFYHKRVIEYCSRPYEDVNDMNEALIKNWNESVSPVDEIFILGDYAFTGTPKKVEIANRLNGKKYIVLGNHDDKAAAPWQRCNFTVIKQGWACGLGFNLSHYPYAGTPYDDRDFSSKQLKDDGRILLHGHVHLGWKKKGNMVNVGVDVWDYKPVSINSIRALFPANP